ncbi:MAG TPA: proton-conducting transporter membrane subunit [Phycisphaerae bacterium]|nr:proton-conducting transporter membrane subunit [Phycisphaerae bacterium]
MESIVPLLVAFPLGMAFAVVAMAHVKGLKRLTAPLAVGVVLANLILTFILLGAVVPRIFVGGWGPDPEKALGIEMLGDGLSKMMLVIINLVALVSLIFAGAYMRRFTKVWLFQALFLLMTGAMNGVVLAGDLFNLFVFLEVAAIASYALVAFGCESEELEAAFRYLVLGTVGSAFILLGVTILYSLTGQLNMAAVAQKLELIGTSPAVLLAAAALIAGLSLKAAMVPFHAWLPDAHPSAPAPVSAMLSGVLIKASGIYAIARLVFNVFGPTPQYATILIALGAASMVLGMLMALGQWDLKRLLAYSSISQAGYIILALGVAAEVMSRAQPDEAVAGLCLFGGLFHLFNHAAFKGLLFLASGSIEQQVGTRQLKEMGGLGRSMRVTGFCCRIGALSIAGVPPFNGFFSKLIIIIALAMAHQYVLCAIAAGVAVGTLLMYVKVQRYALEGPASGRAAGATEAPVLMCVALVVLAAVCVAAGVAMVPLRDHLFGPARDVLLEATKALSTGVIR